MSHIWMDLYLWSFSAAMRENFPKEVEDATILRDMGTNVFIMEMFA